MQEDKKITGEEIEQHNEVKDKQHTAGENHQEQDTNEVHTQAQHQSDDDANDTHIFGNQKDDKHDTADEPKVNKLEHKAKDVYPGVSSKQR
eukprot:13523407-Heterocapsa_arctica.AAC.1